MEDVGQTGVPSFSIQS